MLTYSATLDVPERSADTLIELLVAQRPRRGTGVGARAVTCREQAIVVLRWFRDNIDVNILAAGAGVSIAAAYRYLHEGIDVLADQAPERLSFSYLHSRLAVCSEKEAYNNVRRSGRREPIRSVTTQRLVDRPDRTFQIWAYTVGMRRMLLRSTRNDTFTTRVDVLFRGVRALHLPTFLDGLVVTTADDESTRRLEAVTGILAGDSQFFAIETSGQLGYVVADFMVSEEDEREYFEPSAILSGHAQQQMPKQSALDWWLVPSF